MSEQLMSLIPIVIMFVAVWFVLIRPAQKRQKTTQQMQSALKRGDQVVTIGGLHGEVEAVEDTVVTLKIANGTVVKFERQAIGRVLS